MDHINADKTEKDKSNPMVDAGDVTFELFAKKPADGWHQSLKNSKK